MKTLKFLVASFLIMMLFASCQSLVPANEIEGASVIVEASGTKDELFAKCASWAVSAFNNSEAVIEYQDKEAGVIKGKYNTDIHPMIEFIIESVITIEVKDNKARITIEPTGKPYTWYSGKKMYESGVHPTFLANYTISNTALILDFENALKAEPEEW